jgi:hypothetical protein
MAITRATNLAAVGSGLGDNPAQPVQVGAAVTIGGAAGVVTATTFSGNATGLSGEPVIVIDSVRASDESTFLGGLKVTGVTTSTTFSGNITGTAATFSGGVSIADSIFHTGDTDTAIRFPAADTFTVETAGSEALRVDSSGRLLVGTNTSQSVGFVHNVQVEGTDASSSSFSLLRNSDNAFAPQINFGKTRGTSTGSNTVVQDDDSLGQLNFRGGDGTDKATSGARIEASVDGTPGSNDMPGRLTFHTTADGDAGVTERLRINSSGDVIVNGAATGSNAKFEVQSTTGSLTSATARIDGGKTTTGAVNTGSSLLFAGHDGANGRDFASLFAGKENGTSGNYNAYLAFGTRVNGGAVTEKLRVTSTGGVHFNNAELIERVKITSGKLSDNTTINLDNGMVHYFTTTETTTAIPNITTTAGINTNMATGDTMSVTIITTAATAGYSTGAKIDAGATLPVLWNGGDDPSEGGSGGVDAYTYQIIKTGDAAFTILGNVSNFA